MTEDQQPTISSKERKTSIHEIRNQDFVSRLLAATPPYLYSAPVGPNNFFFSDMLRSLVQAKNNENARNIQLQQAAMARRPRKRSWSQHRPYYEHLKERKEMDEKLSTATDKPLELTNKQIFPIASKYSKHLENLKENSIQQHSNKLPPTDVISNSDSKISSRNFDQHLQPQQTNDNISSNPVIPDPPAASLPPADLALPPPPPVWYPSLYPPYGIDPLHFFIDLRVSGHIYDRKKDNPSPLSSDNNSIQNESSVETTDPIGKYRHGSAFTVPTPRNESKSASAINLTTGGSNNIAEKIDAYNKYYDIGESKENQLNSKNANYVLQNLPRLYSQFAGRDSISLDENNYDNDNKSDCHEDDDDGDEQSKEGSGHIDVEMIAERCQSPDEDDNDTIHQID